MSGALFYDCMLFIFFIYLLQRSIVEVEWTDSRKMNIYRAGHKGKVMMLLVVYMNTFPFVMLN